MSKTIHIWLAGEKVLVFTGIESIFYDRWICRSASKLGPRGFQTTWEHGSSLLVAPSELRLLECTIARSPRRQLGFLMPPSLMHLWFIYGLCRFHFLVRQDFSFYSVDGNNEYTISELKGGPAVWSCCRLVPAVGSAGWTVQIVLSLVILQNNPRT